MLNPNIKKQKKVKLITSLIIGALLPLFYFVVVTISPIRYVENNVDKASNLNGINGFIEFYGVSNSIIIYLQATIICAVIVYIIWSIYAFFEANYKDKA